MSTMPIMNLLNISTHSTKIEYGFLKHYELSQLHFISNFLVNKFSMQMVRQSTIPIVNRPRLSQ